MPVVPFTSRAQMGLPARPQVSREEYLMAAAGLEAAGILKPQEALMEFGHHFGPSDESIVEKATRTDGQS